MAEGAKVRCLTLFAALAAQLLAHRAWCEPPAMLRTVNVSTRDELRQAVERAQPGTKILVAPGNYRGGLDFTGLQGTEGQPIVIAAQDEKQPPVFQGGGACFHLTGPSYVELHHLVLADASGNGLNIDDGGSSNRPAHHLVLRGLQVADVGPRGNRDGIKLSGVDHFIVADCTLERWGDGGSAIDMVGCHQGQINGCTFRHRTDMAGNGVQTKGGSAEIAIRHCRFENAGGRAINLGGSTGEDYFRPRSASYEAKDITVEDCTLIGSMSPIAFVGVDGATVRFNTIYRPTHWVVRILQESRGERFVPCRNGSFTNNVIAFRSDELRTAVNVGDGTTPATFKFAMNHWYCLDNPQRSSRLGLPVEETNGHYGVNPQFILEDENDLRLTPDSPVRKAGVRTKPAVDQK